MPNFTSFLRKIDEHILLSVAWNMSIKKGASTPKTYISPIYNKRKTTTLIYQNILKDAANQS